MNSSLVRGNSCESAIADPTEDVRRLLAGGRFLKVIRVSPDDTALGLKQRRCAIAGVDKGPTRLGRFRDGVSTRGW
jgi:hypothetical protein